MPTSYIRLCPVFVEDLRRGTEVADSVTVELSTIGIAGYECLARTVVGARFGGRLPGARGSYLARV